MSKAVVKSNIDRKKIEIANVRTEIAALRKKKKDTVSRYATLIKNASSPSSKISYRNQKSQAISSIDSSIRVKQYNLESKQRELASLRIRLKREK